MLVFIKTGTAFLRLFDYKVDLKRHCQRCYTFQQDRLKVECTIEYENVVISRQSDYRKRQHRQEYQKVALIAFCTLLIILS